MQQDGFGVQNITKMNCVLILAALNFPFSIYVNDYIFYYLQDRWKTERYL